ncbi:MAG: replicative DNA helicase [Patescibacteria group bacterium]|nr:replicative DNA helicase [Patescibacteria group bacterium]
MSPNPPQNKLKVPPQNMEAEQAVLGGILIDKNAIFKVADILSSQDFYSPGHERIYDAILDLYQKHQPIDVISVGNLLKEKGSLKDIGGSSYLAELTNQIATASHITHYAQLVKEKKVLRDLIKASGEITEDAFDASRDIEEMMDDIEQKILAISQKSMPKNFVPLKDELKAAYERIEQLHQGKGRHRGVPTGFDGLDNILSGLQKSDLVVLGARPSLGKTSLMLDIARHAATKEGIPVGIFSLEMSREQVIDRLVSAESQVSLWKILTGKISNDTEFQMIQQALDRLSQANIFIDDTPSLNIIQMRSMARRLQVEHGLGLLTVDYLQLLTPRTKSDNVVQQVTEISRGLKALARELKVPVLTLSQLNRAVDQRDHKMPRLSDLRESGAIEQDADVVMFIYRKDRDKLDVLPEEQNIAQISIAKHRNGPLGSVDLYFDAEHTSFRTIETRMGENTEF